jgi:hypothetical protein
MNDQWQVAIVSDRYLFFERRTLLVARRVVVVVVESRFSDGDDARLIKKVGDRGNTVTRFMGMKADRGEHIIVMTGGIKRSETAVSVTTHDDECVNSSLTCHVEGGV